MPSLLVINSIKFAILFFDILNRLNILVTNTEIQSVVSTRQNATNIQLNQIANQTSESLAKVSKDYANSIATSNKFGYIAGGEFH